MSRMETLRDKSFKDDVRKKAGTLDIKMSGVRGRNLKYLLMDSGQLEIPLDVNFANKNTDNISSVGFTAHGTTITPGDQEMLLEDNTTNQRLRLKFANNGTQWQVDLTDTCSPVKAGDIDKKYEKNYELMDVKDDRFKIKYPKGDKTIQKEYQGEPVSHYPPMGNDGTEAKQHEEAMRKRPWIPIKKLPDRLPTADQYPYPPVESPLIGSTEPKQNLYLLLAHAYNQLQERCEELEKRIEKLEKG